MKPMGRPSVFRDKNKRNRVVGILTDTGAEKFNAARQRLSVLSGMDVELVSDGDVVEFLARGANATREYLRRRKRVARLTSAVTGGK